MPMPSAATGTISVAMAALANLRNSIIRISPSAAEPVRPHLSG
jgi:hypothetical protein